MQNKDKEKRWVGPAESLRFYSIKGRMNLHIQRTIARLRQRIVVSSALNIANKLKYQQKRLELSIFYTDQRLPDWNIATFVHNTTWWGETVGSARDQIIIQVLFSGF